MASWHPDTRPQPRRGRSTVEAFEEGQRIGAELLADRVFTRAELESIARWQARVSRERERSAGLTRPGFEGARVTRAEWLGCARYCRELEQAIADGEAVS